jgi:phenylacetate-CoA ligase
MKSTSGSTGEPTKFYQTKEDFSWIWAAHFRAWGWAGYLLGDKYAKISINDDRHKIKKKIQDILFRCLYIRIYNMNQEQIRKHVNEIMKFKPVLIYGYSSSLNSIADYMLQNGLTYKAKAIITTGDNLKSSYRKKIEDRFLCKVYDEFGCGGEGLYIAAQCEEKSYHINDELMITEVEDKEIVITSLNNYAMPLIRYKTDDFVTLGKKCKCNRRLTILNSLDGRTYELVRTRNGTTLNSPFFELLFESLKGVTQFKIIQKNLEGITVQIKKNNDFHKKRDEKKITQYITKPTGPDFKIEFEYVNNFHTDVVGKSRTIETMLK